MVRIHYINLCFDWWYFHGRRTVEWIFEYYIQIEKNLNSQLKSHHETNSVVEPYVRLKYHGNILRNVVQFVESIVKF